MQSLCSIGHSPQQDNPTYSETVLTVSSRLKGDIPVNSEQKTLDFTQGKLTTIKPL